MRHINEYSRLHISTCLTLIFGICLLAVLTLFTIGFTNDLALAIASLLLALSSGWLAFEGHHMVKQHQSLKKHGEKLTEAMDIQAEFLQIASHQLRTPLTSLYGLVELDAAGYPHELPPEKHQEFHEKMLESASQLTNLVNGLLSTLKLEGDDLPLLFKKVDILKTIAEAAEVVKKKATEKHIKIVIEKPTQKIPPIDGDQEYLRQVFINLIDNAERYTPANGSITIKTHIAGSAVVTEITDTGIGITPDEQKQIFQKFARADRARKIQPEGTGLGLYIASKIAAGHHGNLEMVSSGADQGTTARITIPLKHKNVHYHLEEEKDPG